ncbi:MAG: hypothetical protein R6X34_01025 [Chloroflexota bacterium]
MHDRFSLSWDTILLLILMTPHMWFNPASNALVVVLLAVYVLLDIFGGDQGEVESSEASRRERWLFLTRFAIVIFMVAVAVVLPTALNIIWRLQEGPATYAHDGLIQTEEAIKYILQGQNPYTEDYVNTPMADFAGQEPPITDLPLYHNPYLPFLFLVSIPAYWLSEMFMGWYDQRLLFLAAYFMTLLLLLGMVNGRRQQLTAIIAIGLNFLYAYYLADGRNDVMVLFGLVLTTVLLVKRHVALSAVVLGMTVMLKHSAWFFLPFYFVYLLPPGRLTMHSARQLLRLTWPFLVTVALILIPFLLWDASALFDDTVAHIVGSGEDTLPIRGWGLSTLLLSFGVIPTPETDFPFIIFVLLLGLPTLYLTLRQQWRHNTIQYMWVGFALFSFVMQFFSRFFNDNYFVFVLQALIIGHFARSDTFHTTTDH